MSDWIVPLASALIAAATAIYATWGKRSADRGDLADRLWDQLQEGWSRELLWRDYTTSLRRQLETSGQTPAPYPDGLTR